MPHYPEGLLMAGERVLEHLRPHWRMLVVPAVAPPLLAAPVGFVAALASRESWRTVVWIALAVLAVVLLGWFCLAPLARWRCTHLAVTDRRLLVREGVVSRAGIDVAASEITAVRLRQTLVERMLGCGTLIVATRDTPDEQRWEFEGIPHLERVAGTLEEVAELRGGFAPADDGDLDEAGDLDDADRLDGSAEDGWGAWDADDPGRRSSRRASGTRAGLLRRRPRVARTSR